MSICEVEFKQSEFHEIVVSVELSMLAPDAGETYRSPLSVQVEAASEEEEKGED
jgi:hypothetical protein